MIAIQHDWLKTYIYNEAGRMKKEKKYKEAEELYDLSIEESSRAVRLEENSAAYYHNLADIISCKAILMKKQKKYKEAENLYHQAAEMAKKASELNEYSRKTLVMRQFIQKTSIN